MKKNRDPNIPPIRWDGTFGTLVVNLKYPKKYVWDIWDI